MVPFKQHDESATTSQMLTHTMKKSHSQYNVTATDT